jgi:threonine aldolase
LRDGVWLTNAQRANASASLLAAKLRAIGGFEPVFPCEANAIFLRMTGTFVSAVHARGWHFYKHIEPDIYRLMCSWAVTEQALNEFVADVMAVREV